MVSIRSDDIRGRWGRLIDNTASFTNLDLSGVVISGLVIQHIGDHNYSIYKDTDGVYKARNDKSGTVQFSGSLEAVVSSALVVISGSNGDGKAGSIHIEAGKHTLFSGFNGWDLPRWTNIYMDKGTYLFVPNGYSGYVFRMADSSALLSAYYGTKIENGYIRETGTTLNLWTAIRFESIATITQGIYGCDVEGTIIQDAGRGIHFLLTGAAGTGYINGVNIRDVTITNPGVAVEFEVASGVTAAAPGPFNRNLFEGIRGQSSTKTYAGFKNIGPGVQNTFIECKQWDMSTGISGTAGVTANIVSGTSNTIILGGIMRSQNFTDNGTKTWALDDISGFTVNEDSIFQGTVQMSGILTVDNITNLNQGTLRLSGGATVLSISQAASGQNQTIYITPGAGSGANASVSLWANSTLDRRFFLQQTATNSIINALRQTAGGTAPNLIFQIQDVPNGTTFETMRFTASGDTAIGSGHAISISGGDTVTTSGGSYLAMGKSPIKFNRVRIFDSVTSGEGTNALFVQSEFSGGPAVVASVPNLPVSGGYASLGTTVAGFYAFATDYKRIPLPYDAFLFQIVSVSGATGQSGFIYQIIAMTDNTVSGDIHPIQIGMVGQNRITIDTDSTVNFASLGLKGMALAATINFSGQIATNVGGIRGDPTAGITLRGNSNSTDISGQSFFFQILDPVADTFNTAVQISPTNASGSTLQLNSQLTIGAGASGISFSGLQMLPTMGAPNYVVWVSGSTYRAMNTATGIIEQSGTDLATVIQPIISGLSLSVVGGYIHLKTGTYNTSGTSIGLVQKVIIGGAGFSTQIRGEIDLSGVQDCGLRDLWIRADDTSGFALNIHAGKFCTFNNVKFTHNTTSGVAVSIDGGATFTTHLRFHDCIFVADWRGIYAGISTNGAAPNTVSVHDSYFQHNTGIADASGQIGFEGQGSGIGNKNFIIKNCYFETWNTAIQMDSPNFDVQSWIDGCNVGIKVSGAGINNSGTYKIEVRSPGNISGATANINGVIFSGTTRTIMSDNDIHLYTGSASFTQTITFSGATNFAGTNIMSGTTAIRGLSGLNWTGVFTSGGVSGGSGASFSGMIPQGYINLQVSGNTVKVPFFN